MNATPIKFFVILATLSFQTPGKTIIVPKEIKSIQAAVEKANPGDTVFVLNGIYRESITLKDGISLIGESPKDTRIQGNKRDPVIKGAEKTLIKKLTIENGRTGIRCENTSPVIENCIIKDNKGTGIHCLIALPQVRNCVIFRNHWTGLYCESSRSIRTLIDHNIFAENGYSGVMLAGKSEVLIQNNVFYNNKEYGIWAGEESHKSRIIHNNFFGNRFPNNLYAKVDRTNIHEDPNYNSIGSDYDFFGSNPVSLKAKGKDGVTIGIVNESALKTKLADYDRDGVPDEIDACPNMPEDIDGFEDEDGCPDFDNDNDGIYDSQDNCPDVPEDFDGFRDDDGCDDFDNDGDGIVDEKDLCPNEKETVNGYKDDDGCPDEVPVSEIKDTAENAEPQNNSNSPQKLAPSSTKEPTPEQSDDPDQQIKKESQLEDHAIEEQDNGAN